MGSIKLFVGYYATVDGKGRVTIPKEVREKLGMKEGTRVEIEVEGEKIIITVKKRVTVDDIYGIAGRERVDLEEVEGSLGYESND